MYELLKHILEADEDARTVLNEGLVDHAKGELERVGMFNEDSDYGGMLGNAVMELMQTFAKQGHSGCSADMTRELFSKLAKWEPLSPVTNNPNEWTNVSEFGFPESENLWQSKRNPALFSKDGGKTHYHVETPKKLIQSESYTRSPLDQKQGGRDE